MKNAYNLTLKMLIHIFHWLSLVILAVKLIKLLHIIIRFHFSRFYYKLNFIIRINLLFTFILEY